MFTLECEHLRKEYDNNLVALYDLSLQIEQGTSFGLLGENGAGKSTFVKLVMGFIYPTSGTLKVLGEKNVAKMHHRIGYVHEQPLFDLRFTGREWLSYASDLSQIHPQAKLKQIEQILDIVQINTASYRRISTYSKGMLQKLSIAQALLTNPDILILDEITSGLDPRSQWEIRQVILKLHKEGKTVLLCSHYLAEVEELCDSVGILRKGQMVKSGKVHELLKTDSRYLIIIESTDPRGDLMKIEPEIFSDISYEANEITIPASRKDAVLAALIAHNISIHEVKPLQQSLEDIYLRYTQPEWEKTDAN